MSELQTLIDKAMESGSISEQDADDIVEMIPTWKKVTAFFTDGIILAKSVQYTKEELNEVVEDAIDTHSWQRGANIPEPKPLWATIEKPVRQLVYIQGTVFIRDYERTTVYAGPFALTKPIRDIKKTLSEKFN